jgi:polar amino acid transport system substrate-binding protein
MTADDTVRKQFAPSGTLIVGVNLGNPIIVKPGSDVGEPQGIGPALGKELARRLGLPLRYVKYETAGKLAAAVSGPEWDVAFLAVDPDRATEIDFTDAYVHIDGAYMVPATSELRTVDDVDRPGVRIAVAGRSAYDLHLTRHLKHATIQRYGEFGPSLEAFQAEPLEVIAGIRQPLLLAAERIGGLRVLDGSFMTIRQASAVPKGRPQAYAFLVEFIEDVKRSGFAAEQLRTSGVDGGTVAPPRR